MFISGLEEMNEDAYKLMFQNSEYYFELIFTRDKLTDECEVVV